MLADKIEEKEKGLESRVALKQQIKRNKKADRRKKAKRKYDKQESEETVKAVPENPGTDTKGENGTTR